MTVTAVPLGGAGADVLALLPSPILQNAHGQRDLSSGPHSLFPGFRFSARSGVFFADTIDHEIESTAIMARQGGLFNVGRMSKYLKSRLKKAD
jgi:hypothetical protein